MGVSNILLIALPLVSISFMDLSSKELTAFILIWFPSYSRALNFDYISEIYGIWGHIYFSSLSLVYSFFILKDFDSWWYISFIVIPYWFSYITEYVLKYETAESIDIIKEKNKVTVSASKILFSMGINLMPLGLMNILISTLKDFDVYQTLLMTFVSIWCCIPALLLHYLPSDVNAVYKFGKFHLNGFNICVLCICLIGATSNLQYFFILAISTSLLSFVVSDYNKVDASLSHQGHQIGPIVDVMLKNSIVEFISLIWNELVWLVLLILCVGGTFLTFKHPLYLEHIKTINNTDSSLINYQDLLRISNYSNLENFEQMTYPQSYILYHLRSLLNIALSFNQNLINLQEGFEHNVFLYEDVIVFIATSTVFINIVIIAGNCFVGERGHLKFGFLWDFLSFSNLVIIFAITFGLTTNLNALRVLSDLKYSREWSDNGKFFIFLTILVTISSFMLKKIHFLDVKHMEIQNAIRHKHKRNDSLQDFSSTFKKRALKIKTLLGSPFILFFILSISCFLTSVILDSDSSNINLKVRSDNSITTQWKTDLLEHQSKMKIEVYRNSTTDLFMELNYLSQSLSHLYDTLYQFGGTNLTALFGTNYSDTAKGLQQFHIDYYAGDLVENFTNNHWIDYNLLLNKSYQALAFNLNDHFALSKTYFLPYWVPMLSLSIYLIIVTSLLISYSTRFYHMVLDILFGTLLSFIIVSLNLILNLRNYLDSENFEVELKVSDLPIFLLLGYVFGLLSFYFLYINNPTKREINLHNAKLRYQDPNVQQASNIEPFAPNQSEMEGSNGIELPVIQKGVEDYIQEGKQLRREGHTFMSKSSIIIKPDEILSEDEAF
jgi:hypothetical protein